MTVMLSNVDPALRRCWFVVARSDEVGPDPVPITLLGEHWVLARLGGELSAFPDRCPHRLAPLSAGRVDGEVLRCGYHGWCFDAAGNCTGIPALSDTDHIPPRARLEPAAGLRERDGFVFLAPERPLTEVLDMPDAWGPGFQQGYLPSMRASVGAGLMMDNFLDMAHFPFLHAATIGTDDQVHFDMDVQRDGYGKTVTSEHLFPNSEDPGVATGERPLLQRRRLTYRYHAPFSISLRIDYIDAAGTNILVFHVQPETDESCRLYTLVARNDLDGDEHRLADAVNYELKIVEEDLALQERYRDRRLPLDLTTEVHVKVDRPTIELRRILHDLVVAASTEPGSEP